MSTEFKIPYELTAVIGRDRIVSGIDGSMIADRNGKTGFYHLIKRSVAGCGYTSRAARSYTSADLSLGLITIDATIEIPRINTMTIRDTSTGILK
jgi:hypothetical protein